MTAYRCALCPAASGAALAAGWTTHTLAEPVAYRSIFTSEPLPPTPAGTYHLCPACSDWLTDHRDRALPASVVASIDATLAAANLQPRTARRTRAEMVGMVRHLAEALE